MSIEKAYGNAIAIAQANLDRARIEGLNIANQAIQQAEQQNSRLKNQIEELQEELQEEVSKYEKLLCKPMDEIAVLHGGFANTYERSQLDLANWILSQGSYKELAYRYGALLGKSLREVRADASGTREDSLAGRNDPRHQANAGQFVLGFEERLNSNPPGSEFQAEYNKACEEGRIHRLGDTYRLWSDALDAWLEMAEGGNSAACYNAGRCYDRGDGVDHVPETAEHWYLRAHELGDKLAAYNLHLFYTKEKPDHTKAATFIEESEGRGDPRGIAKIAELRAAEAALKQARSDIRKRLEQAIALAKDSDEKVRAILRDVPRIDRGKTHDIVIEQVAEVDPILADRMRCFVGADFKVSESNSRNLGMIFAKWVADVKFSAAIPDYLKRGSLSPSVKELHEIGCTRSLENPVDPDLFDLADAVCPKGEHLLSILANSKELPRAQTTGLSLEVNGVKRGTEIEGVKVTIKGHAFAVIFEKPVNIKGY